MSSQVVFDLMVCVDLETRCGVESPVIRQCLQGWRARLEPINAEILTPLLITATEQLSLRTHLLLPGLKKPKVQVASHTPPSSSAASSNASVISGLFPPTAASRFSLLPLPMSTHFQGQSWVDRDRERERERDRDRDRELGQSADRLTSESTFASKSILSGLSLSQQQVHAEQLGKSLISSWGTFLGSNANANAAPSSASNPNSNMGVK